MRDQLVPQDPLFPAPRGTAGSADDGAIDAPQFLIDRLGVEMGRPEATQDLVESPVAVPLIKQVPDGAPGTELLGQVTPGRAGAEDPKDAVEHLSAVARRAPGGRRGGGETPDPG